MKNYKPRKRLKCCGNCKHWLNTIVFLADQHNTYVDPECLRFNDYDKNDNEDFNYSGLCDEWEKR